MARLLKRTEADQVQSPQVTPFSGMKADKGAANSSFGPFGVNNQKSTETQVTPAGEPPFDRGFWSGRKGSAIGTADEALQDTEQASSGLVFADQKGEQAQTFPADLRRSGPFTRGNADLAQIRNTPVPKAVNDAKVAGVFSNKPTNLEEDKAQAEAKPILQLDDFEPQTAAWRRNRKEPVAPRVHPNPKPVMASLAQNVRRENAARNALARPAATATPTFAGRNKAKAKQDKVSDGNRPLQTSERSSLVLPIALLLVLFIVGVAGYVYLSKLAEESADQRIILERTQQIKDAEIMLSDLDMNPGTIDGQIDRQLTNAVIEFQKFAGIAEDGEINDALMQELRAVTSMLQGG